MEIKINYNITAESPAAEFAGTKIQELINLKTNPDFLKNASQISLARLRNYIETKIDEYKEWNGERF